MTTFHTKALFILFAMIAMLMMAPTASAQSVVTCGGTEGVTYTPGITNTSQTVTVGFTSVIGPCTGLGAGPVWGVENGTNTAAVDCSLTPGSHPITGTINWSDGSTSALQSTSVVIERPLGETIIVETDTVTSGTYSGATVVRTAVFANTQFDACSTAGGVTAVAGPITTVFTLL